MTAAGETFEGGDTSKCPGETNCDDWNAHGDEESHEIKEEKVCHGCPMFVSKPASGSDQASEIDAAEIEETVDEIADMIFLADGGHETDWGEYPIEIYRLFCEWRRAEKHIAEKRQLLIDRVLKANYCK